MRRSLHNLPANWQWQPLGKVAKLINGRAYKKHELLEEGPVPVLRVGNFFSNRGWYYSDLDLPEDKYCYKGDLLYAWSASFGPKIWDGKKAIFHYHIWKIELTEKLDKGYLYYLLAQDSEEIKSAGNGIAMMHATKGGMEERKIPLPPLAEQKQIAAILDAADSLRQKNQQLVEHYSQLSQSLFLDMFGDPLHNNKNFERSTIGKEIKIQGGSQPPKSVFSSEPLEGFVRLVQIRDYKSDKYLTYVPSNSTKKFCSKNDVMIGRYGPPVFQILRGIEGAYNVALMKATPLSKLNTEYVFYLLSCLYIQNIVIGNSKRTAGQTGVNLKLLNSIEISIPPLELQNQFAERIEKIEQQKQQAQANLTKSNELFNSLLQKAFTGELTANKAA